MERERRHMSKRNVLISSRICLLDATRPKDADRYRTNSAPLNLSSKTLDFHFSCITDSRETACLSKTPFPMLMN